MSGLTLLFAATLNVVTCDQIRLPDETWLTAKTETIRIFNRAGIELRWIDSERGVQECQPPSGSTLVVVVAKEAPQGWVGRDAMGFAPADTSRVYLFYDKVTRFIGQFVLQDNPRVAAGVVLGHAIAHEIGHVLIRDKPHGGGIMRADWVYDDWKQMFAGTLLFDSARAKKMRALLTKR
jgi:hypothetical protein